MKSTARITCFSLLLLLNILGTKAQNNSEIPIVRPVDWTWTLSGGSASVANTYLSPRVYDGWGLSLRYQRWRAMKFAPQDWVMRFQTEAMAASTGAFLSANLNADWSMIWRKQLPHRLTAGIGGNASANLGGIYCSRNGNNPAQALASVAIGPTGYLTWTTNIRHTPLTLGLDCSLPLIGAFFCPEYGQLYYEIYMGERSGLVHCLWLGNCRHIDTGISADFRIGPMALRIGYRLDLLSSKANHTINRLITNMATIGISGCDLTLNHRKPLSVNAKIISAYY